MGLEFRDAHDIITILNILGQRKISLSAFRRWRNISLIKGHQLYRLFFGYFPDPGLLVYLDDIFHLGAEHAGAVAEINLTVNPFKDSQNLAHELRMGSNGRIR